MVPTNHIFQLWQAWDRGSTSPLCLVAPTTAGWMLTLKADANRFKTFPWFKRRKKRLSVNRVHIFMQINWTSRILWFGSKPPAPFGRGSALGDWEFCSAADGETQCLAAFEVGQKGQADHGVMTPDMKGEMGLSQEPKFGFSKKTDVFFKQSTIDDSMRLVGFCGLALSLWIILILSGIRW